MHINNSFKHMDSKKVFGCMDHLLAKVLLCAYHTKCASHD